MLLLAKGPTTGLEKLPEAKSKNQAYVAPSPEERQVISNLDLSSPSTVAEKPLVGKVKSKADIEAPLVRLILNVSGETTVLIMPLLAVTVHFKLAVVPIGTPAPARTAFTVPYSNVKLVSAPELFEGTEMIGFEKSPDRASRCHV